MASIVVVGGGVAGLTCAWRLRRAGHAVEVLDREQEFGARLRPQRADAAQLERGAVRLHAADARTRDSPPSWASRRCPRRAASRCCSAGGCAASSPRVRACAARRISRPARWPGWPASPST